MADVSFEGIPVISDPRNHRLRLDRHGEKRVVLHAGVGQACRSGWWGMQEWVVGHACRGG